MRYLLITGSCYYPSAGTGDWQKTYASRSEAESTITRVTEHQYFQRGPRKGEIKESSEQLYFQESKIDWYEIIDLQEWLNRVE